MKFEYFIAQRYFWSKKKTGFVAIINYFSVGGVLLGVAALIIVLSVMNGFEEEVQSRIIGITSHITVLKFHYEKVDQYAQISEQLQSIEGVVATAPFVYAKVVIATKEVQDGVVVRGIDSEPEKQVSDIAEHLQTGTFTFSENLSKAGNRFSGIVLGKYLADRLRVGVGDEVVLMSLNEQASLVGGFVPKIKKFTVNGIFLTGMYEYDANLSYISLPAAQQLFNMGESVSGIQVKVKNPFAAQEISKEIEKKILYPFYALDWMTQNRTLFSWMKIEKWGMFIILSLIVVVAAFNIISSLIMVVLEKTREIGILKSMGASATSIMKIFIYKGTFIGLIGTTSGCLIGLLLSYLQMRFKFFSIPADIYFINSLPVIIKTADVVTVTLASLAICILSTLYPAWKAARLYPVEAIRYD